MHLGSNTDSHCRLLSYIAWAFKLIAFLYKFAIPGIMHRLLVVYFGLNKKW